MNALPLVGAGALAAAMIAGFASAGAGFSGGPGSQEQQGRASLSKEEAAGILFMWEEEKLAHDVYTELAKKWGPRPFGNIQSSEEVHMDMVKGLALRLGMADPDAGLGAGRFQDKGLQKLYGALIKQGARSRVEALKVGAAIEDLDLFDLDRLSKSTQREEVISVYDSLMRGSRNHLRAFVRVLSRTGDSYKPQHITQKAFDEITAAPQERGWGGPQGGS